MSERAEKERAEFEKIWLEVHPDDCAPDQAFIRRNGDPNGTYVHDDVEECWQIWQAARSTPDHRDERIRELEAEIERERKEFRIERLRAMAAAEHDYGRHERADDLAKRADRLCDELDALSNSLPTEEDK
jgi:DNA repair ATPase RecN